MDAATFLVLYAFELDGLPATAWGAAWQKRFPANWIPLALVEALYQGRYKAISVDHLLQRWQQRGHIWLVSSPDFYQKIWPEQRDISTRLRNRPTLQPSSEDPAVATLESAISPLYLLQQLQQQDLPAKLHSLIADSN